MKSDSHYEEEDFARTLSRADVIMSNPKQKAMAKRGASRIAKEKMIEAKSMARIAKSGPKKPIKAVKKVTKSSAKKAAKRASKKK